MIFRGLWLSFFEGTAPRPDSDGWTVAAGYEVFRAPPGIRPRERSFAASECRAFSGWRVIRAERGSTLTGCRLRGPLVVQGDFATGMVIRADPSETQRPRLPRTWPTSTGGGAKRNAETKITATLCGRFQVVLPTRKPTLQTRVHVLPHGFG